MIHKSKIFEVYEEKKKKNVSLFTENLVKGKDVYDLLVGHEVGHALYTPTDGWHDSEKKIGKIPRAYLNIVEDIRIERMIQETYPGIVRRFKNGYKRLFDDNLFGTDDRDINKSGLMDRLNVSSKGRGYVPAEENDKHTGEIGLIPISSTAIEIKKSTTPLNRDGAFLLGKCVSPFLCQQQNLKISFLPSPEQDFIFFEIFTGQGAVLFNPLLIEIGAALFDQAASLAF